MVQMVQISRQRNNVRRGLGGAAVGDGLMVRNTPFVVRTEHSYKYILAIIHNTLVKHGKSTEHRRIKTVLSSPLCAVCPSAHLRDLAPDNVDQKSRPAANK